MAASGSPVASRIDNEDVRALRDVLGDDVCDMDLVRALHLSRNDLQMAAHIVLDTPGFRTRKEPKGFKTKRSNAGATSANNRKNMEESSSVIRANERDAVSSRLEVGKEGCDEAQGNAKVIDKSFKAKVDIRVQKNQGLNVSGPKTVDNVELQSSGEKGKTTDGMPLEHDALASPPLQDSGLDLKSSTEVDTPVKEEAFENGDVSLKQEDDVSVVGVERIVISVKLEADSHRDTKPLVDQVFLQENSDKVPPVAKERPKITDSVVFDSERWWLLKETEVSAYSTSRGHRIRAGDFVSFNFPKPEPEKKSMESKRPWGRQKPSPDIVRFGTSSSGEIGRLPADWAKCLIPLVRSRKVTILGKCKLAPASLSLMSSIVLDVRIYINKSLFVKYKGTVSIEETTFRPLPSLMDLLKMTPLTKAQFTPEDLNVYTRKPSERAPPSKRLKPESKDVEESAVEDSEVDHVVGTSDSSEIQEMDEPAGLECKLRPYQKQALFWMSQLEIGVTREDAARTLHPCWSEYDITDKRASAFYVNAFSGEATLDFPSALQTARGGILADAMGLGKTVMTIALLLANRGKGSVESQENALKEINPNVSKGGGTLIICPMTLLSQWKSEFELHVSAGTFSVYAYYGPDRSRDSRSLSKYDVVLTTYGVVQSECHNSVASGSLQSVNWFRIVLDEAHSIKASKSRVAQAVFKLVAERRLCLTGTPVQNKLEDMYSLFHFLRVEPWCNWGWWHKLIQKPYEEGDERGLKLLQSILKPLMLRRTKDSTDKEGRPILVLPPAQCEIIECHFSEPERDFYDALFHRSKVKFDQFVEQGKVLHNYASILELLLRLRQTCDHPFLVMSRGDTEDYADLDKLARRFLGNGSCQVPSTAYVKELVDDLRNRENAECPICLETPEDAVLTPCAHRMCRECLFNSWGTSAGGPCPLCRHSCSKQDLITAPTGSRFRINVEEQWKESSKVEALLTQLQILRDSGAKSVVFSQWTAFLDLLEIPLKRKTFQFVRLDGTLSQRQRENVLKEFSTKPAVSVMLISLKAGGVGLNLTAASNAFLMDPWWNPAVEEQAIMRIHRIGQTKDVLIKRFIVKDSVEERMQQVQARKQRLIAGALTDEEVRSARIEELKMLFR